MAKATTGITNLYLYNRYVQDVEDAPSSDINDTESIRYIIDQVNDLISKKCDRNFGTQTYKEWVRGECTPDLILDNYPITKIRLISAGSDNLATVEGTGFAIATVSSNASSFVINSIAGDGYTEAENVFNYSDYANVSSLVTAVDAITGWDSEVIGDNDSAISSLIRPIDNSWALDTKVYLTGPYLGTAVRVSHGSDGILEKIGGGIFRGEYFVWYDAGYTLPVCDDQGGDLTVTGNVPEGLTLIANAIIKDVINSADEDRNFEEEWNMDYRFVRGKTIMACIDRHWRDLSLYARKSV